MSLTNIKIRVDNGKYTFVNAITKIDILRHGQAWHSQSEAFNALIAMMVELDAARVVLEVARLLGEEAPIALRYALKVHASLVSDNEPPSAWSKP